MEKGHTDQTDAETEDSPDHLYPHLSDDQWENAFSAAIARHRRDPQVERDEENRGLVPERHYLVSEDEFKRSLEVVMRAAEERGKSTLHYAAGSELQNHRQ